MRITAQGILFLAAAFPFLIPLVPFADTQPTFALFALLFAGLAILSSFDRRVDVRRSDMLFAAAIVIGGLLALIASFAANRFDAGNVNRMISFGLLLVAIAAGLLNRGLISAYRVTTVLKIYAVFTAIYFTTNAAVERLIIRSRSEEALSMLTAGGRGAATLSPEPSFFAFQIFTIFMLTRLTAWHELTGRQRHVVQILTVALLLSSLAGYGIVYAAIVVALAGWRYMLSAVVLGGGALVVLAGSINLDALRFVQLFASLATSLSSDTLKIVDLSAAERLKSFSEYLAVFAAHPWFGDAFAYYGGGGLGSLPAAVGLYGLLLLLLFVSAILVARTGFKMKLALFAWFVLQYISGPVGLPFVGLLIGMTIAHSKLGAFLDAIGWLRANRGAAPSPTDARRDAVAIG
ncbi:hypothetical protein ACFOMD_07635 [Sphingoaurantiacus capsulatus]|uniref:Uncharacterized protein n=1 Tax=Sphingoaurantiacus capsulatus TaxID=1771310 RepID=A0ABV7X8I4_9SPHN